MTFRYSISNALIFLLTFLLQVFVLLQVDVFGVGFPMIYFMVLLFVPVKQPAWWVLPLAFLCGFSVDFFTDTGGMHAAATVFTAFLRFFLLNRIEPQNGYAADDAPGFRRFPPQWMLAYLFTLVFLHHFAYFLIEDGGFGRIGLVLLKTLVSGLLTGLLMLLINLFIFRR